MSARFARLAAASALALLAATAAAAKQNSCDDPIVIGTTISMTGALASLMSDNPRYKEMFDVNTQSANTGVDMAKMKIEVAAAHADRHGVRWRDMLVAELPRYAIHKTKLTLDRQRIPAAVAALKTRFSNARADELDGLRLDWPDRWLLVRASNTEPIVRAIAEAPTPAAAQQLCDDALEVMSAAG